MKRILIPTNLITPLRNTGKTADAVMRLLAYVYDNNLQEQVESITYCEPKVVDTTSKQVAIACVTRDKAIEVLSTVSSVSVVTQRILPDSQTTHDVAHVAKIAKTFGCEPKDVFMWVAALSKVHGAYSSTPICETSTYAKSLRRTFRHFDPTLSGTIKPSRLCSEEVADFIAEIMYLCNVDATQAMQGYLDLSLKRVSYNTYEPDLDKEVKRHVVSDEFLKAYNNQGHRGTYYDLMFEIDMQETYTFELTIEQQSMLQPLWLCSAAETQVEFLESMAYQLYKQGGVHKNKLEVKHTTTNEELPEEFYDYWLDIEEYIDELT